MGRRGPKRQLMIVGGFLNERGLAVLRYISDYRAHYGYSPTNSEIRSATGPGSQRWLRRLIEWGYVERGPGARALAISGPGRRALMDVQRT